MLAVAVVALAFLVIQANKEEVLMETGEAVDTQMLAYLGILVLAAEVAVLVDMLAQVYGVFFMEMDLTQVVLAVQAVLAVLVGELMVMEVTEVRQVIQVQEEIQEELVLTEMLDLEQVQEEAEALHQHLIMVHKI
jgi:hypothetical protein